MDSLKNYKLCLKKCKNDFSHHTFRILKNVQTINFFQFRTNGRLEGIPSNLPPWHISKSISKNAIFPLQKNAGSAVGSYWYTPQQKIYFTRHTKTHTVIQSTVQ